MVVLGIDSATPGLGIAIAGPDGVIVDVSENVGLRHAQGLLPTVQWALDEAGLTVADLDAVAVTVGPGSFTAVRIGLNTAKGLCMSRDLPLVGISTLEAMAGRFPFAGIPVAPWLDAKRSEVYAGLYDVSSGVPVAIEDDTVIAPVEWLAAHKKPVVFTGDGASVYGDLIREQFGDAARFAPPSVSTSSAAVVATLGRQRAVRGETMDPDIAAPVYLRRPQAVEQRAAGR